MEKLAKEVIEAGDVPAAVDYAIELYRRITALSKDLNEVKAYLREVAKSDLGDSGARTASVVGNLGTASVVFERDTVRAKREMNLADIEENLSDETFARLFVTRVLVEPTSDILDKLAELTPAERAVIENFLEVVPSTPKVYLPK
jgi:hypothetical protein